MRARVNDTELYFDVEGAELVVDGEQLRRRPTLIALHGGPGFDQGYLRPGLAPIAEAITGACLVELRDAGHFGFSETPTPFLAAVRAHINCIRSSPSKQGGERSWPNEYADAIATS